MLTDLSLKEFLDQTASNSPAPGGGSISALAAALGAALTSMVCRLTLGKKKYANVQTEIETILQKSEHLRAAYLSLVDEDTQTFNAVMAAYAMPKETDEQMKVRTDAIQSAIKAATLVPVKVMELCLESLRLTKSVAEKGNQNSLSDAQVAALMIKAGCKGAACNVQINLASITDLSFIEQTQKTVETILGQLD